MAEYAIDYKTLKNLNDRFNSIISVLDRNYDVLRRMSSDILKGMEREASMLAGWSQINADRKDSIRKASDCLQTAAGVLYDSEKSVYGLITDVSSKAVPRR